MTAEFGPVNLQRSPLKLKKLHAFHMRRKNIEKWWDGKFWETNSLLNFRDVNFSQHGVSQFFWDRFWVDFSPVILCSHFLRLNGDRQPNPAGHVPPIRNKGLIKGSLTIGFP